jgi:hypothetical protein
LPATAAQSPSPPQARQTPLEPLQTGVVPVQAVAFVLEHWRHTPVGPQAGVGPLQSPSPRHCTQAEALQKGVSDGQLAPHVPQLAASVVRSVQTPPHAVFPAGQQTPLEQWPLVQSLFCRQRLPSAHAAQVEPPQSMSVSCALRTPSWQVAGMQKRAGDGASAALKLQTPLWQSVAKRQRLLSAQGEHEPPQSTSLSSPFSRPSAQPAGVHTPATQPSPSAQRPRGSCTAMTGRQVPTKPFRSQREHAPLQGLSQQTPSSQEPLWHWFEAVQAVPLERFCRH